MMRRWVMLVLVVFSFQLVAPALAPQNAWASESAGATVDGPIPWAKIWQFVKNWGPLLLSIADELWHNLSGGGGQSDPKPQDPGSNCRAELAALCMARVPQVAPAARIT
jgi:hypothetical protein